MEKFKEKFKEKLIETADFFAWAIGGGIVVVLGIIGLCFFMKYLFIFVTFIMENI